MLLTSYALETYTRVPMAMRLTEATRERTRRATHSPSGGPVPGRAPLLVARVLAVGIPRVRPPRPIGGLPVA
jgi:hypothetical protein